MSAVVVQRAFDDVVRYEDTPTVTHKFEIGQDNGVLLIIQTISVESMFSVPDEEECIRAYGDGAWEEVYRE